MGCAPVKNKQIEEKIKEHSLNRIRSVPIRPYDPNFPGIQYNVTINGVLFQVINPPDLWNSFTELTDIPE